MDQAAAFFFAMAAEQHKRQLAAADTPCPPAKVLRGEEGKGGKAAGKSSSADQGGSA